MSTGNIVALCLFIYVPVMLISLAIRADPTFDGTDDAYLIVGKSLFWPLVFVVFLIVSLIKVLKVTFTDLVKTIKE
jgi:hypothetical protein